MFNRLLEVTIVLERLREMRVRDGWAFMPIHVDGRLELLTGARGWPGGWSDAIAIRDLGDAKAYRCDPVGGVVWQREGCLPEVLDGLLTLPAPTDPRAPRLIIGSAPRLWTP